MTIKVIDSRIAMEGTVYEMFRRVPEDQWAKVENRLAETSVRQADVETFLSTEDFSEPIFQDENLVLTAMKAFIEKKIDVWTYSTLMLYQDVASRPGYQLVSEKTGKVFFYRVLDPTFEIPGKETFIKELYHDADVQILYSEGSLVIVPPKFFFDALKKRASSPIEPRPVHGYSSPEDFTSPTHRDIFLPNPYFPGPEKIHGHKCEPLEIYIHDLYFHLDIDSYNPHRKLWIAIAKRFKELRPQYYLQLLDRDFPIYKSYKKELGEIDLSTLFWLHIVAFSVEKPFTEQEIRVIKSVLAKEGHESGVSAIPPSSAPSVPDEEWKTLIQDFIP